MRLRGNLVHSKVVNLRVSLFESDSKVSIERNDVCCIIMSFQRTLGYYYASPRRFLQITESSERQGPVKHLASINSLPNEVLFMILDCLKEEHPFISARQLYQIKYQGGFIKLSEVSHWRLFNATEERQWNYSRMD